MIKGSIRPILTIGLVSLLFLVTGAVATKASFNDTGVAQITATSGTLTTYLTTPENVTWPPSFYNLDSVSPGASTHIAISTITNSGTMTANYTATLDDDSLYAGESWIKGTEAIQISIEIGGSNVYTGSLRNLNIPKQSLSPGEIHTIKMTLSLPNTDKMLGLNGVYIYSYVNIQVVP